MPQKPIPDPEDPNSLAIIDGALCRMNRKGRAVTRHEPIGTAVVQFLASSEGRLVVREHASVSCRASPTFTASTPLSG